MSQLLARLLLAMSVVIATPIVYVISFVLIENSLLRADAQALLAADFVSAAFLVTSWILVWRRQVVWTTRRRFVTVLSVVWSAVPGLAIALLMYSAIRGPDELAVIIGGMSWSVVWLASTALVWRENPAERTTRLKQIASGLVQCPHCGYNMTGLEQARCPECGTRYTLNELFAALQEQAEDLDENEKVA